MSDQAVSVTLPVSIFNRGSYRIGGRRKVAVSLRELIQQSNSFSKKYTGGCTPKLVESSPKEMYLRYKVTCTKADSDPNGHDVKVRFAYEKIEESSRYDNLDVKVSCSCPAFLYWGAQWNSHKRDALEGEARPLLQAPTERLDLRADYVICKHVHVVLQRVIPSVQRVINDKIRTKTVEENKRRFKEEEEAEKARMSPVQEPQEYTQEDITPEYTQEDITPVKPEDLPEYTMEDLQEEPTHKHTPEEKSKLPYDVDKMDNARKGPNRDEAPEPTPEEETTVPVEDGQEEDQKRRQDEDRRKSRPRRPKPGEGTVDMPPKGRGNPDQPQKRKPKKAPPKPVKPTDLPRPKTRSGVIE